VRFKSTKIQLFARLRSAVLMRFRYCHSQIPNTISLNFNTPQTVRPDTAIVWHCKLDTPIQVLYNACKHFSCKIIHATHAKQGATKTEQSRRKLRNKTTVLIKQLLFIQVTEKHRKINFRVAPQQKNKGQGFYTFYI
jgi:hypothetical protein